MRVKEKETGKVSSRSSSKVEHGPGQTQQRKQSSCQGKKKGGTVQTGGGSLDFTHFSAVKSANKGAGKLQKIAGKMDDEINNVKKSLSKMRSEVNNSMNGNDIYTSNFDDILSRVNQTSESISAFKSSAQNFHEQTESDYDSLKKEFAKIDVPRSQVLKGLF